MCARPERRGKRKSNAYFYKATGFLFACTTAMFFGFISKLIHGSNNMTNILHSLLYYANICSITLLKCFEQPYKLPIKTILLELTWITNFYRCVKWVLLVLLSLHISGDKESFNATKEDGHETWHIRIIRYHICIT